MPPKKSGGGQPSKKTEEKKKQKIIEDKTFGLKNKKGAKMQKYIAQIERQVAGNQRGGGASGSRRKEEEKDDLRDISKIFKPVQDAPKVAALGADVDPKSVLCQFFKAGLCTKGDRCKFSHDLAVAQKTAKKNLYFDSRDLKKDGEGGEPGGAEETNADWDEEQLTRVAEKKHGEKDRKRPNQTDIVCKYFIEAVESSKYGWFWECPNGDDCIYRHALPPGFVLKRDKKKMDEQSRLNTISLEELIEKERAALSYSGGDGEGQRQLTKVTLESFRAWKRRKLREKRKRAEKETATKRSDFLNKGKQGGLSGRELLTFNPLLGAEEAAGEADGGEEVGYGGAEARENDGGDSDGEGEDDAEGEEEVKAFEIDEKTFLDMDDLMDGLSISSSEDEADEKKDGSKGASKRDELGEVEEEEKD